MLKPKKKIEVIFYLIKRMPRDEKRRFKLYNQIYKRGNKDFVKLFDFINGMQSFDNTRIEKFFMKEEVGDKNICISYLLNKLIEIIDDGKLYLAYSGYEVIIPHFKTYRAYVKMELMELAQKELLKTEQLAEQYELYEYIYQIYQMKEKMANVLNLNTQSKEYRRELYLKHIALSEKIKTREHIKYIISIIINYSADSQEFKDANDELLQYDYDNLSVIDKIEYNHACSWCCHKLKEYEERFKYIYNVIGVYHDNPDFITLLIEDYIATWNNLLLATSKFEDAAIRLKYYEEYKFLATKYKKEFAMLPDAIIAFYELIGHLHEISVSVKSEQYTATKNIGKNTLITIKKFPTSTSRINIISTLFAKLSYGFILIADFKQAEFWADKLLNLEYITEVRFFSEMTILKLVLLYEQDSFILLKSQIRSLKRKWGINPPVLASPMFMLELLHSSQTKRSKDKEFWKSAYQKILKIETENLYIIPYSKWIAQKI